jgi:hypothetical protein
MEDNIIKLSNITLTTVPINKNNENNDSTKIADCLHFIIIITINYTND